MHTPVKPRRTQNIPRHQNISEFEVISEGTQRHRYRRKENWIPRPFLHPFLFGAVSPAFRPLQTEISRNVSPVFYGKESGDLFDYVKVSS